MKMKFKDAKEIITIEEWDNELKLSERANELNIKNENPLMREITSALKKTIDKEEIVSLSAPAIGYNKRVFCMKFSTETKTFINPVIGASKGLILNRERCTSIKDREFIIPRATEIEVMYQRPTGQIETKRMVGEAAFRFQHEINHLDGILLSDMGLEIDEDWDNATDEEREEVVKMYIESLDIRQKEIEKDVAEDPECKQVTDAIDFMTSVYNGETQLVNAEDIGKEGSPT